MPATSGFFKGQIGATISLDTEDDVELLAVATKLEIHYRTPSGIVKTKTASRDGTVLSYVTTATTDFPEAGDYIVQVYVEGTGWKMPGAKVTMRVEEPLGEIT
jgi:hypothetical protein